MRLCFTSFLQIIIVYFMLSSLSTSIYIWHSPLYSIFESSLYQLSSPTAAIAKGEKKQKLSCSRHSVVWGGTAAKWRCVGGVGDGAVGQCGGGGWELERCLSVCGRSGSQMKHQKTNIKHKTQVESHKHVAVSV